MGLRGPSLAELVEDERLHGRSDVSDFMREVIAATDDPRMRELVKQVAHDAGVQEK